MEGFLAVSKKRNYERATEYLDFRYLLANMPQIQSPHLARQFKVILDRALWIDPDDLSTDPAGHQDDGLPPYRDGGGHIDVGEQTIDILVQHVPGEDGILIWKFSNATVAQIPRLYEEYGYGYLGDVFPETFFDLKVLGIEVWLWVGLVVITILAYGAAYSVTSMIHHFVRSRQSASGIQLSRLVRGPGRFLLCVLVSKVLIEYVNPPIWFRAVLQARTLITIAIVCLSCGWWISCSLV